MLNPKDNPSVNDVCLNCTKPDCPGFCEELRQRMSHGRKNVQTLEWRGFIRTINQWANVLGIPRKTLYNRMNKGLSVEEILDPIPTKSFNDIPKGLAEDIYIRLSNMHHDYIIFWDRPNAIADSAGMVTNYNKIQISKTHKVSSIVEQRAIPEILMTEEANIRRQWIACVIDVIKDYRRTMYKKRGNRLKANILEWRAIDGLTLTKIVEKINEELVSPITVQKVRSQMNSIVVDIAAEAIRRGLYIERQK